MDEEDQRSNKEGMGERVKGWADQWRTPAAIILVLSLLTLWHNATVRWISIEAAHQKIESMFSERRHALQELFNQRDKTAAAAINHLHDNMAEIDRHVKKIDSDLEDFKAGGGNRFTAEDGKQLERVIERMHAELEEHNSLPAHAPALANVRGIEAEIKALQQRVTALESRLDRLRANNGNGILYQSPRADQ